jgi:hypothetical protein
MISTLYYCKSTAYSPGKHGTPQPSQPSTTWNAALPKQSGTTATAEILSNWGLSCVYISAMSL